jgi:hypothetical protein
MLERILAEKKSSLLKRWFDLILETYPADTQRFLKKQKDPFANPVGATISRGIAALYEEILKGADLERVSPFLDAIIRVRAVQDFSPSQALNFVFLLKRVAREALGDRRHEPGISEELAGLESKIDEMALLSFDIFMRCRERIYEIRANEVRNRTIRLLKRANLICEIPDDETDVQSSPNNNVT